MLAVIDKITSLLAPHECLACGQEGALLCPVCRPLLPSLPARCYGCGKVDARWRTCRACRKNSPLHSVRALTPYEGVAEVLLRQLKFERAYAAGGLIGEILSVEFSGSCPNDMLVIPVPTVTSRVRQRGYDQSALIARMFAKQAGLPFAQALQRFGQQRQTNSSRRERLHQLEGAFGVRAKRLNGHKRVLLVDDVLTTGATIETAARELKAAGAKQVHAVVFARTE